MLTVWRENSNEKATIQELSLALSSLGYEMLAKELLTVEV